MFYFIEWLVDLLSVESVKGVESRCANFQVVFVVVNELNNYFERVLHELEKSSQRQMNLVNANLM